MLSWVLDPLQYGFMQRALLEVVLIAVACGPVGALLSLRRLAYAGESLSHALVPGAAVFISFGLSGEWGAVLGALLAAVVTAFLLRRDDVREDVVVALVFSVALAVGVALLSLTVPAQRSLAVLFGDILAVDRGDLIGGAIAMAIVSGVVLVGSRAIALTSFDRGWARTIGIRVGLIDAALLLATALALGVALRGLGGLLALAMLIGPAAIARPWVRRVGTLLLLTIPLGLLAGCLGLLVSFHFGWAAGPAIATIIAGLFLASRGAALAVDARSRSANAARHA